MEENIKSNASLDSGKLDTLYKQVLSCADFSVKMQENITRDYKSDGTVLTATDLEISKRIISTVKTLFPECNIISEEEITPYNINSPYTFVLDPIDGTDVYSNGFPTFAIALGIIDNKRNPVGCMIVAPRFGKSKQSLEIRLDPFGDLFIDGQIVDKLDEDKNIIRQITISSKSQKRINFDNYIGKIRTFGSTIIHIICPVVFPFIQGCINQRAYIWDICASHAVLNHLGMQIVYEDGSPLIYDDDMVVNRKVCKMSLYCGTEKGIKTMMKNLPFK